MCRARKRGFIYTKHYKKLDIFWEKDSLKHLRKFFLQTKNVGTVRLTISDSFTRSLSHQLKAFFWRRNRLKHLEINMCNDVVLKKCIQRLVDLKSIKLKLNNSANIFEAIKSCRNLGTVEIDFSYSDITESNIIESLSSLGNIKQLEKLVLNLSGCSQLSPKTMSLLSDYLSSMKNLRCLNLMMEDCSCLDDTSFANFTPGFMRLSKLGALHLNFSQSKLSDKTFMPLFYSLREFQHLHTINFILRNCNLGNRSILKLRRAIVRIPNLRDLRMVINGCYDITRKGYCYLQEGIKQAAGLTRLSLSGENFKCCGETKHALRNVLGKHGDMKNLLLHPSFPPIEGSISNLSNIIRLNIQFKDLNDSECLTIANELSQLVTLKTLTLYFTNCLDVSESSWVAVLKTIKSLTALQDLAINMSDINISDRGLRSLIITLGPLVSLRGLDFFLQGSNLITNDTVENMISTFCNLPKASELALTFLDCYKLSLSSSILKVASNIKFPVVIKVNNQVFYS